MLEYANLRSRNELCPTSASPTGRPSRTTCACGAWATRWTDRGSSATARPRDYAELASKTARAMRQVDPDLELVVCGSSSAQMPTFGTWERVVLEETYDDIDFISCHAYYEPVDGDYGSFLASAVNMDRFIDSVVATADHVKAVRGSDKTINISFDEWNVWYQSRYQEVDRITAVDEWPVAPRLLEDSYSVVDAVVFGNLLISLIRHADRVTAASLAQLVNVIAPIMTEPGGPAWRQTTFFPFAITSRLARGVTLELKLDCPTYETAALRRGAGGRRGRHVRRRERRDLRLPGQSQPRRGGHDRHRRPPARRRPARSCRVASTTTTSTPRTPCTTRTASASARTRRRGSRTAPSRSPCPRSRGPPSRSS